VEECIVERKENDISTDNDEDKQKRGGGRGGQHSSLCDVQALAAEGADVL
jgi:hypothetical protein